MGLIHYAQDPQTSFFTQTFIKNGSHDTIYTFKNYFTIVLLVFVFNFQQNIRYLNTPFIYLIHHFTIHPTSMLLFFRTQLNTIHLFIILSLSLSLSSTHNPMTSLLLSLYLLLLPLFNPQPPNPQPNVPFEEFTSRVMIVPKQQGEKPRQLASLPKRYLKMLNESSISMTNLSQSPSGQKRTR